ncbi:MAG: cytochrome c [Oligoflexales bacterium]
MNSIAKILYLAILLGCTKPNKLSDIKRVERDAIKQENAQSDKSKTISNGNVEQNQAKFELFYEVIKQHCASCHSEGGLASNSNFASLTEFSQWSRSKYIIPGNHLESSLYFRLKDSNADGSLGAKDMPYDYSLNDEEIEIIANFIDGLNTSSEELNLSFEPDLSQINLLSYEAKIDKLRYVLDPTQSINIPTDVFTALSTDRYLLGDYNFAQGVIEQKVWGNLQMESWLAGLSSYCSSELFQAKYSMPEKFSNFIETAFGRSPTPYDQSILDAISTGGLSGAELTQVVCLSFLSSLEFQTQTPPSEKLSLRQYLSRLSSTIVHRPLNSSEISSISEISSNPEARDELIKSILSGWVASPRFPPALRKYVESLLRTSGETTEIDYGLPGYLAEYIAKNNLPLSTIITSKNCIDENGNSIACDSGASFGAGVLTTRAFLAANKGPYNLSRAGRLLHSFACKSYPLDTKKEPPIPKKDLIPVFAATNGEGFGNGTNCYLCHSQFGKHTQLFVKFDDKGIYQSTASGQQNPDQEVAGGHSIEGLYTSHFLPESSAQEEESEFFGTPVKNLREAANVLAKDPEFVNCAAKNILGFYLRLKDTTILSVDEALFEDITNKTLAISTDPSFGDLIVSVFTHPEIIRSMTGRN